MDLGSLQYELDRIFFDIEYEQPHTYKTLDCCLTMFYVICIFCELLPEQDAWNLFKQFDPLREAFNLELEEGTNEDIFASYKGTQSAYFVVKAYNDIRNNEENILTNFPIYEQYVKSKGKASLSYKDAIAILPQEGTPFYEATKTYCKAAKKSLNDIRAARILLRKLFKLVPKDTYRYADIVKLYNKFRNMYAYETVFNFYYM